MRRPIRCSIVRTDLRSAIFSGASTRRQADPLSIVFMQNAHMLMAWCHLRQDFRALRLDWMQLLTLTGAHFRPRRVPMSREYMDQLRAETLSRAKDRQPNA